MDIWPLIWGIKTQAIFDVWTIEHILSGISVGSNVQKRHHKVFQKILRQKDHTIHSWHLDISGVLFLAYAWEALEHYLEIGLAGPGVAFWFQGVEHWSNRLIADPAMLVLGYIIAKHYPQLVWPARIASIIWMIVHIFVFPHSMYLHEVF